MKPREVGGLIKKVKVVYLYVCLAEQWSGDPEDPASEVTIVGDWFEVPKAMARVIVDRCKELKLTDDLIVDFDEGEKALYVGDPGDDGGEEDPEEEETPAGGEGAIPGTEYAHGAEEDDANEEEEETP